MYTKKNKSMRTVQQDKKSTGFFYCNLDNNNKNQMNGSAIFFCKKKQSAFLRCWTIHSFSLNLFNAVLLTLCFGFASCFTFYFLCCTSCFSHSFLSCSVCNLACAEFYGSDELSHPLLHLIDINRVRALAIIKLSSKLKWCVCVRFFRSQRQNNNNHIITTTTRCGKRQLHFSHFYSTLTTRLCLKLFFFSMKMQHNGITILLSLVTVFIVVKSLVSWHVASRLPCAICCDRMSDGNYVIAT